MHNKFVKGIASVLGAALVLGSVVMSAVPANAATSKKGSDGYETTYTAQELNEADLWSATVSNSADGAITITFEGQYNQAFFDIPDGVVAANWKSVTIETGDSDSDYTVKLNDRNGTDGGIRGVLADYPSQNYITKDSSYIDQWGGDPAATEADFDKITLIDIMNGRDGSNTVTLKSITFVTEKEVAGVSGGNTNSGSEDTNTGDNTTGEKPANNNAPKTGESMNGVLVVCVLGGLLLISVAGLFLTKQRKNR